VLEKAVEWTDQVSSKEVLNRIKKDDMCLYKSFQKHKMAFLGHVLRASRSESDLTYMFRLQTLEGKLETTAQRRLRQMWLDDTKQWTKLKTYEAIKRATYTESLCCSMSTF